MQRVDPEDIQIEGVVKPVYIFSPRNPFILNARNREQEEMSDPEDDLWNFDEFDWEESVISSLRDQL